MLRRRPLPSYHGDGWFYRWRGRAVGPVPISVLREMLGDGRLQMDVLLWAQGLDVWTPASQFAARLEAFGVHSEEDERGAAEDDGAGSSRSLFPAESGVLPPATSGPVPQALPRPGMKPETRRKARTLLRVVVGAVVVLFAVQSLATTVKENRVRKQAAIEAAESFQDSLRAFHASEVGALAVGQAALAAHESPGAEDLLAEAYGKSVDEEVAVLAEAYMQFEQETNTPESREHDRLTRRAEEAERDLEVLQQRYASRTPVRVVIGRRFDEMLSGEGVYDAMEWGASRRIVLVASDDHLRDWPYRKVHDLFLRADGEATVYEESAYGGARRTETLPRYESEGSAASVREARQAAGDALESVQRNLREAESDRSWRERDAREAFLAEASPALEALQAALDR